MGIFTVAIVIEDYEFIGNFIKTALVLKVIKFKFKGVADDLEMESAVRDLSRWKIKL